VAGDTRPIKIYEYVFFYRTIVFAVFSAAYADFYIRERGH